VITDDDAPLRALKQELATLEARQLVLQHELSAATAPAPLLHLSQKPNSSSVRAVESQRNWRKRRTGARDMRAESGTGRGGWTIEIAHVSCRADGSIEDNQ
jgi:phage shock protein A